MSGSEQGQGARSQQHRRASRSALGAFAALLALGASFTAFALASANSVTVSAESSAGLGETIVVNAQGRTLYALSPETAGHLLCKSSECLHFWPPLTVPSRSTKLKDGAGVRGHLGILRRSNGLLQVTLRGLPLYRFLKDHAKGQTNGQGIESFGGTWHAVTASSDPAPNVAASPAPAPAPTPTPATPTPTTSAPTPWYGY